MIKIFINFYNHLLKDRDFLFKLKRVNQFNEDNEIFAHIMNFFLIFVQLKNFIFTLIKLLKHFKLKTFMKY